MHVDAFLYDEETVDSLCEEGKMSRNYCLNCGSHRTAPLGKCLHGYLAVYINSCNKKQHHNMQLIIFQRVHLTFILDPGAPVPIPQRSSRPHRKTGGGCGI